MRNSTSTEVPSHPLKTNHFAYRITLEQLRTAADWLRERGIEPRAAFGNPPSEPIAHTWMPAASLYFHDPDGNSLEFIALLDEEPKQLDYTPYWSEWNSLHNS